MQREEGGRCVSVLAAWSRITNVQCPVVSGDAGGLHCSPFICSKAVDLRAFELRPPGLNPRPVMIKQKPGLGVVASVLDQRQLTSGCPELV